MTFSDDPMRVFVTGGAGFIGSHVCTQLLADGHEVYVYDNFSTSREKVITAVERLSNKSLKYSVGDICDYSALKAAMEQFKPDAVLHFAGLKSVSDSVNNPLLYYRHNVYGSIQLLTVMDEIECDRLVFSSSATVYGKQSKPPFSEAERPSPVNPYGTTKAIVEQLITDWCQASSNRKAISLRYFNPVGAHPSGLIGEDPTTLATNLMPIVLKAASGELDHVTIYGNDYATRDGTGERDYIHVMDLAMGHVKAVEVLKNLENHCIINLGTGRGTTVMELITEFEKVTGKKVPFITSKRRSGDVDKSVSSVSLSKTILGFECKLTLEEMCRDAWHFRVRTKDL